MGLIQYIRLYLKIIGNNWIWFIIIYFSDRRSPIYDV